MIASISSHLPQDNSLPNISGGYIWKKDKPGAGDVPFYTSRGQEVRMVEPDDRAITVAQKNWLSSYLNEFEVALYGANFTDPVNGYAKYIDVDSWVNLWILVELTKNIDGFRLSTYYHKDRNGKIEMGPAWDYDLSLANGNYLEGAFPTGWYGALLGEADYPYWGRLFQDPNFKQKVIDRWDELRQGVLSTESMHADIDAAVNLLSDNNPRLESPATGELSNPISRNYKKWGGLTSYYWPNCFFGQGSCPPSPLPNQRSPRTYGDYLFILKDFVERRAAWIDSQFPRGPVLDPASRDVALGSTVTMTVPAGWEAYYSVDGTDPRFTTSQVIEKTLFASGGNAQVLVPSSNQLINACTGATLANPSQCFVSPNYSPGQWGETWTTGATGIGYDLEATYVPYIKTDLRTSMYNAQTTAYARIPFDLTANDRASLSGLQFKIRYDDGFVAYVWSEGLQRPVEILRVNAGAGSAATPIVPLAFNANASASNADASAVLFQTFDVSQAMQYLRTGKNYIVVQALNSGITSSDFLFDIEVVGTSNTTPTGGGSQRYTAPIRIEQTTELRARLYDPARRLWSGVTTANYITTPLNVVVSELHYHPAAPSTTELAAQPNVTDEDFEFVEIRNVGSTVASLAGASLAGAVEFDFSPVTLAVGEYAVIVKNLAAFRSRYGNAPRVLGQFSSGNLDNSGETLQLLDGLDRPVAVVTYSDDALWPQRADGIGASLELKDPAATPVGELSKYYRWRGSVEMHGSPGRAGLSPTQIVINEVVSNTDAGSRFTDSIELFNSGTTTVDLSGWYLSDASSQLRKYRLPDGTQLGAGRYLVLQEEQFNPTPATPAPSHFSLDGDLGDDVWLAELNAQGQVVRFIDDVHFGASRSGESLARVPNGSGWLTPLLQPTLSRENLGTRVGPLLVSEVMYQPATPSASALQASPLVKVSDLEYLEISNTSGATVDLMNWRIRGGVDFDFSSGLSLASGASLVVVSFDPTLAENQSLVAAFRAQYQLAASVRLVGGYAGSLSDNGERVVLQRPTSPSSGSPNVVPRIIEDEVIYDNFAPWPVAAAGTGVSLQRTRVDGVGHLVASWQAVAPTPGISSFGGQLIGDFDHNGSINGGDLDLFAAGYRLPVQDLQFDLSGDGRVDEADRDQMVQSVMHTSYGDSDLDLVFNSSDLIVAFQAGEYEDAVPGNSTWRDGDWNCDGDFDSGDMVLAFQAGRYQVNGATASRDVSSDLALALSDAKRSIAASHASPASDAFAARRSPEELRETGRLWSVDPPRLDSIDQLFAADSPWSSSEDEENELFLSDEAE